MKRILGVVLTLIMLIASVSVLTELEFTVSAEQSYSGTVYYVDADNGDDTNSGTSQSTAWQSLEKVNSITLQPGDAVLLKKGCIWTNTFFYPKGAGTSSAPITISSYGSGDMPMIKSMYDDELDDLPEMDAALFLKNTSYVIIDGLHITNGTPGTGTQYVVRVALNNNYTSYGIEIKNCYIYGSNTKNWSTASKSGLSGITVSSDTYNGYIGSLLVENNTIVNCKSLGISINGSVSGSNKDGSINSKSGKNVVVRGNYLQNIGKDGILVNNCYAPLVEYNTCDKAHSYAQASAHVAIWPFASHSALLQYNEAFNTQTIYDGQGFDCDYQCYNTIFQYNYSHNNEGGFMLICCEPTDWNNSYAWNVGSIVRYNISQNDYHYVFSLIGAIDDTQIYNNTIYSKWALSTSNAYIFYTWTRGASKLTGRSYANNTLIANNIFYTNSHRGDGLANTTNTTFANNISYGRYAYSAPLNGSEIVNSYGNIFAQDPMFINAGGAGVGRSSCDAYMLYDCSPAIGAGIVIEGNGGYDFYGNTVSAQDAPNIGAYNGSGVKYNREDFIIDDKYMSVIDFEDQSETYTGTSIDRLNTVTNCSTRISDECVNSANDSTKAVKIYSNGSTAATSVKFTIYSGSLSDSTGIRFWVSGNGTERNGSITFTTSDGSTYSKSFAVPANGGYVTFSWNEKYTGSNELRVTPEMMSKTTNITFSCRLPAGQSWYLDDIQKNTGEFDDETVKPAFYYPKRETVLVEDFEGYTEVSSHGGHKYGGPTSGPNGDSGSTTYNGSRVYFANSVSATKTAVTSYISYSETFKKLRAALLLDGAEGIQFDMISTTVYSSNGEPLNDVDEYKIYDKRGIYKYTFESSSVTFTSSSGSVVSTKSFYVENNVADGYGLARIALDELKYYDSTTKETFYFKNLDDEQKEKWISNISKFLVSYTTYATNTPMLIMNWYMDNICVYGTFSDDVEKTTVLTTTTTTTTTTIQPTTTKPTTVPTVMSTTQPTTQPTIPTTTVKAVNFGDVNTDGKINGKDVLALRKYIVSLDDNIDTDNADCNKDGKINGKDVLQLRKYIIGLVKEL